MQKQEKPELKVIVKILKQEEESKRIKPKPSIDENDFAKKFKRLKVEFII
jgi:hypothetical protein